MVRLAQQRVLLIGDSDRQVQAALQQAMPSASVTPVANYFEGISELAGPGINQPYTAVIAAVEPIERRPESAVQTLRDLAGAARVVLFGHPTLEPLSRKMLEFGCDDYVIHPPGAAELQQMFGAPLLRVTSESSEQHELSVSEPAPVVSLLEALPLAEILIDALVHSPAAAPLAAVRRINELIGPGLTLVYTVAPADPPAVEADQDLISHPLRDSESPAAAKDSDSGHLHLLLPRDESVNASTESSSHGARHFLSRLSSLMARLSSLQDRHQRLQRMAITDELTGLYNARYFRHFLTRIIEKARLLRFPVTLLLFDIDNFKKYNDQFGHGVGDEILRQTATLMKRCCRDHDLVARLGGDEFAVIFWEKDGPRQIHHPEAASTGRTPSTPQQILDRFQQLLSRQELPELGPGGKGMLTISGGLAVYPWNAGDVESLIDAADNALMFGAKKQGKNSIALVGAADQA